jgi:hypothetical protein
LSRKFAVLLGQDIVRQDYLPVSESFADQKEIIAYSPDDARHSIYFNVNRGWDRAKMSILINLHFSQMPMETYE